jgi:hypothetical protein
MEVVKQTETHTILKRRDGRYAVKAKNKKAVNGDEKAKILADAGLIKFSVKAAEPEAPAEEAPAEEATEETTEE